VTFHPCPRCGVEIDPTRDRCKSCGAIDERRFVRSWQEVADELAKVEGERITRQRCQQFAERAMLKLRIRLAEDPWVRGWLIENGYRLDDWQGDDAAGVAASPDSSPEV
jgi:hypothetical protein